MRGYWCFGFEAFNSIIKRGAAGSGFKNDSLSCMRHRIEPLVRGGAS
jgi:hypothetical protein